VSQWPDAFRPRDTAWAMSEENVEVVERLIAALNAGDVDQYRALCTPDVEYVGPATEIEGVTRGEGLRTSLSTLAEVANSFRFIRFAVEQLQAWTATESSRSHGSRSYRNTAAPGDQPTASLYYFASRYFSTEPKPSKPPGFRSRQCRRRTRCPPRALS
jgi:ketosteroid isomerase-like protein